MKKPVKIALSVVFLIALAGFIGGIYMFNKGHKDLSKVKPDFVITSTNLVKEFEKDEAAATAKYMNRIVEVIGPVHFLKVEEKKVISVTLQTGNAASLVICSFSSGIDPEKFDINKQSTIRGEFSGFLMDILLNNCSLIK
jgi:hypothetical protein